MIVSRAAQTQTDPGNELINHGDINAAIKLSVLLRAFKGALSQ